jgi:glycosyltransferase involved in cell wall biosynthesis
MTHEVARRLAAEHEVVWFTSRHPGLPAEENLDGVRVIRRGSEVTTRLFAPRFARGSQWDVIVEEINTLPYFAPRWARSTTVLFIPQLAREVWWYESPRLLAPLGYALEPAYLALYRSVTTVTISASTRDDLRRLGIRAPIHVIPMAVSTPLLRELPPKDVSGRLVAVGRLVPSKRFDHAIRALAEVRRAVGSATLTIVGEGPERASLEHLSAELGLRDAVRLTGRVPEREKIEILQASDLLVACSAREGWGLIVTEAARLGTPAVAYDVPGLRDSIVSNRTGVLTNGSPAAVAAAVTQVLQSPVLYSQLRERAWRRWQELSWERTAAAFETALRAALTGST